MERYEMADGTVYVIDGMVPQLLANPYADYTVRDGEGNPVFVGPYHECARFVRKKKARARL